LIAAVCHDQLDRERRIFLKMRAQRCPAFYFVKKMKKWLRAEGVKTPGEIF
jgi:hypothetical protein